MSTALALHEIGQRLLVSLEPSRIGCGEERESVWIMTVWRSRSWLEITPCRITQTPGTPNQRPKFQLAEDEDDNSNLNKTPSVDIDTRGVVSSCWVKVLSTSWANYYPPVFAGLTTPEKNLRMTMRKSSLVVRMTLSSTLASTLLKATM